MKSGPSPLQLLTKPGPALAAQPLEQRSPLRPPARAHRPRPGEGAWGPAGGAGASSRYTPEFAALLPETVWRRILDFADQCGVSPRAVVIDVLEDFFADRYGPAPLW